MSSLGKVPTFFLAHSFSIFTPSSFSDREKSSIQKLGCCRAVSHSPLLKGSRLVDGESKKKKYILNSHSQRLAAMGRVPMVVWHAAVAPRHGYHGDRTKSLANHGTVLCPLRSVLVLGQCGSGIFFSMSRRARELKQLAFYSWFVQLHHSKARVFALW